jgi:hypothetical protein
MEASVETKKHLPKGAVYLILLIVIVPSFITAINVIKENNFITHVERLVSENKNLGKCFIYDHKVNYSRKSPKLELFLAGETLTDEAKKAFYNSAEEYGITQSQIIFHEDATSMRQELSEVEIVKGIYEHTDQQIKRLNDSITKLDKQLNEFKEKKLPVEAVSKELFAQYPNIQSISLSRGAFVQTGNAVETEQIVAIITSDASIDTVLHDRIERWLKVRLDNENVVVVNQSIETEKAAE